MLESMKQRSVLLVTVIDFVAGKGLEVADGDRVGHEVIDATTIAIWDLSTWDLSTWGFIAWGGSWCDLLFDELEQSGGEMDLFGDAELAGLGE